MESLNNISTDNAKILPVILCGGEGTRLWPLSRRSFPKQFLSINNLDNKSLLQKTHERLTGIKDLLQPILICNSAHRFIVAEQMREINVNPKSIILEPFGRNTAPAILLAALKSLESEKDPHLLILSSDHQIKNEKKRIIGETKISPIVAKIKSIILFIFLNKSPFHKRINRP